ncbi:MAG: homoserine dehydrogenase, partial [Proteobacteria bacterium]|nr:homoserine dehydrogenase [Pseudomonadota bacterium]
MLKFGSSVLRSARDLACVVSEIYRHLRLGERVISVVSAFEGETDRILADCRAWTPHPNSYALATAVATGEVESATQLVFALERAGVPAGLLDPRDIDLRAHGDRLNAEPASVDVVRLRQLVNRFPVSVVPGFYGLAEDYGIALLGRGGSDLTAVYLAQQLGARCILVKDVDGLYEGDPRLSGKRLRRFEYARYEDAIRLGGRLIQSKAVQRASAAGQRIEVRAVGEPVGSVIGAEARSLVASASLPRPRIFLCGLGTVGFGVYEYLAAYPDRYEVVGILIRDARRHVDAGVPAHLLVAEPDQALQRASRRNADVMIECLGGVDPAYPLVSAALTAGLSVITANKELVATHWKDLSAYLLATTPRLRCSAAVGGAVPTLELVQRLAAEGERIEEIRGVVNGTCNFVLDQLTAGVTLDEAVREAQAKGYAEPDPSADLDGLDAARKLEILCRLGFGAAPAALQVTGIRNLNLRDTPSGTVCRLVARVSAERIARVAPEWLPAGDFLSQARGAENRLEVRTAGGAIHRLSGLGAGRYPTATAVLSDLLDIRLSRCAIPAKSRARPREPRLQLEM